jgi:hypothetical protein
VKIALSADLTSVIFREYVVDVVLPYVESQRNISGKKRQIAILLMDSDCVRFDRDIFGILAKGRAKILSFPPPTTGIFQILDLPFFGVMNTEKRNIRRDETVDHKADQARRVYQRFEKVGIGMNLRACFQAAGFECQNQSGETRMTRNEQQPKDSPVFREIWEIDYLETTFSPRRRANRRSVVSEDLWKEKADVNFQGYSIEA